MLPIAPITPRVAALALRSDGKESEHIGFALSRLAHVAQASQFWISPAREHRPILFRLRCSETAPARLGLHRSGLTSLRPQVSLTPRRQATRPGGNPHPSTPCGHRPVASTCQRGVRESAPALSRGFSTRNQAAADCHAVATCAQTAAAGKAALVSRDGTTRHIPSRQTSAPSQQTRAENNLLRSADGMGDCSTRHGTTRRYI